MISPVAATFWAAVLVKVFWPPSKVTVPNVAVESTDEPPNNCRVPPSMLMRVVAGMRTGSIETFVPVWSIWRIAPTSCSPLVCVSAPLSRKVNVPPPIVVTPR